MKLFPQITSLSNFLTKQCGKITEAIARGKYYFPWFAACQVGHACIFGQFKVIIFDRNRSKMKSRSGKFHAEISLSPPCSSSSTCSASDLVITMFALICFRSLQCKQNVHSAMLEHRAKLKMREITRDWDEELYMKSGVILEW